MGNGTLTERDELLRVLKALADDTRLKIIDLLLRYDFCVGALAQKLGLSEAAISQHLKVLRNAGIVSGEKRGYYTHYDVNRDLLANAAAAVDALAAFPQERKGCKQHLTGDHRFCMVYNLRQEKKKQKEKGRTKAQRNAPKAEQEE